MILADEPTGELDEATAAPRPRRCCASGPPHGTAVLVVTHAPQSRAAADREIRLRDGRLEP